MLKYDYTNTFKWFLRICLLEIKTKHSLKFSRDAKNNNVKRIAGAPVRVKTVKSKNTLKTCAE